MNNFIHVSDRIINTDCITSIIGPLQGDSCTLSLDKNRYKENSIKAKTPIDKVLDSLRLSGSRFIRIDGIGDFNPLSDLYSCYINVKYIRHICPHPEGKGSLVYCDESTGLEPSYHTEFSFSELIEQL